jgi:hypothetical protein
MCDHRSSLWLTTCCLTLAIALAVFPLTVQAARPSALSRWLSGEVIPQLQQLLAQHPRYRGQRIQVASGTRSGLSESVVTLLGAHLQGHAGITRVSRGPAARLAPAAPGAIDALDCLGPPRLDYLLQVSVVHPGTGQDQVQLELLDVTSAGEAAHSWQWRGLFNAVERSQLQRPVAPAAAQGSFSFPWTAHDIDAAALSLSRGLACAMRPQIKTRLGLQWPDDTSLPALFADTANTTRHLLGAYPELAVANPAPDYTVAVSARRLRGDTWQLRVIGTPRRSGLAPVQVVTYFNASDPGTPRPAPPGPLVKALDYFDVQMLDATQTDRPGAGAALQVTLRIGNRAEWPIAYAFTLSAGYFNHCVARADYYRHDRYGHLAGNVAPGDSVVRRLLIQDVQHQPTPWFGLRKCAGFRDLEGFEQFASQGHKVTDFVRWDM